jgi:zinc/manganese transport system substrate-binding protein
VPLKGVPVLVQHNAFPYMNQWLGLKEVATLESKPGVEPSAAHLSGIMARLKSEPARMVLRPAYQHDGPSRWIAERAKIPEVTLPFTVGGTPEASDLVALFDDTLRRLLAALPAR